MIIDVCTYNGEKDLWDLHYNVLKDVIDKFVVLEFDKTFSGKPRSNILFEGIDMGAYPKTAFMRHTEATYGKYAELAERSPNTKGAEHWKREFMQKESIKDALETIEADDTDLVFVGDVDEMVKPQSIDQWRNFTGSPFKIKLDVYTYWLNNRSSEEFYGPVVSRYKWIRSSCLNELRTAVWKTTLGGGWHFTSMGGPDKVREKLTDSYTQESYATPTVLENLAYNIESGKDFLGRPFTYELDESQWPQYLKDNRDKYKHLMSPIGGGGSK